MTDSAPYKRDFNVTGMSKMQVNKAVEAARGEVMNLLPEGIEFDVAEDITSDVLLEIVEHGAPSDLTGLVSIFTEKNVQAYVRRCRDSVENLRRNEFNENKATHVVDESTLVPLEERVSVEID